MMCAMKRFHANATNAAAKGPAHITAMMAHSIKLRLIFKSVP